MAKKGLFSFLFGATLGGLVTMLTSNTKGSTLRKQLMSAWEEGKPGLDVIGKEAKDMAFELKDAISEFYNSDMVQSALKEATDKGKVELDKQYKKAMDVLGDVKNVTEKKVKEAQKDFEKKLENAFDDIKKKKK